MAIIIVLLALSTFYFFGYRFWSKFLAEKVFKIKESEETPANDPQLQDGVDYLPVNSHVLWGHHYTSIAGAAPIIGPAVAVYWGWLPAILWVVFGTIFIGAMHDFGSIVVSVRHQGQSMASVAGQILNKRTKILFQILVYFLIWIVLAVFSFAIGVLFSKYPETVIPVNFEIIIAMVIGWWIYKKKGKLLIPSLVALGLLYAMIPVGVQFPISLGEGAIGFENWAVILLIYAGVASILPVWLLLQPRDFINSHQLVVGLALLILGLFFLNPEMNAPAIRSEAGGAPDIIPMLFITIACGAISGFHGLVGSGTTSKQLSKMKDSRSIGYGAMLGEASLAVLATMAVAAGLDDWASHYHDWNASGINAIANFVQGGGKFLESLFFSSQVAQIIIAVLAISFAATSMDTAARIQRIIVSEFGSTVGLDFLKNRYIATIFAVGPAVPLVLMGKEVWGPLWMLFGTTNQLIGAATLIVLYVYLVKSKSKTWPVAIPLVFVVVITICAMCYNIVNWYTQITSESGGATYTTLILAVVLLLLEIWLIIEAILVLKSNNSKSSKDSVALT